MSGSDKLICIPCMLSRPIVFVFGATLMLFEGNIFQSIQCQNISIQTWVNILANSQTFYFLLCVEKYIATMHASLKQEQKMMIWNNWIKTEFQLQCIG